MSFYAKLAFSGEHEERWATTLCCKARMSALPYVLPSRRGRMPGRNGP